LTLSHPPGAIKPFTALVGFFLNDLDSDWAGNFTVWPGGHHILERYFRAHKPDPDLKRGIPPVDLPEPLQLKVKAGDMVLAHYQLPHTNSANLSHAIRYAVYFRVHHADKPKDSPDVLKDIWKYWGWDKRMNLLGPGLTIVAIVKVRILSDCRFELEIVDPNIFLS
jgi:hypothetical protein